MDDQRTNQYAERLSRMIQIETVSVRNQQDKQKFYQFHQLLRELFPNLFQVCTFEDFDGSFMLHWSGRSQEGPLMLMNHHDVVEASGDWKYKPFSGKIAEGKVWGRGTLDTKGGLFCMLQAAEELAAAGFVPKKDIYFVSACTEESDSEGAYQISVALKERNIRFSMVLDEGGMILDEPIGGAKGTFAMVALGEKGCADLRFVARSNGGHACAPVKNTPLVRLGKFMVTAEKKKVFDASVSPIICQTLKKLSGAMKFPLNVIMGHPVLFRPILKTFMPMVSASANAMLSTTLAFTMAKGSDGANVLPQEAWVMGNMRYSHHQGRDSSIEAVRKLAKKFDVEVEVIDAGTPSPLSSYTSDAFALVERAVGAIFPDVTVAPYLMNGASDSRFMSLVCDNCIRFVPFRITDEQLDSIHGIDENVDLSALAPAVDFYQYIIKEI